MELDTGAEVSLIPEVMYRSLFSHKELLKSSIVLNTYMKVSIPVAGEIDVAVEYNTQKVNANLVVFSIEGPALLGRDLLKKIKLDWAVINQVQEDITLSSLLEEFKSVFENDLGKIKLYHAKLKIRPNSVPKFFKPRPLPELDKLEEAGIIEKVSHSDWATPIVAVPKRDGSYRICGDYKVTVNPELEIDQYPLLNPSDLFASLSGGKKFTKIDLSQAYQQLLLDQNSKELTTINTHQGLCRYTRLPFGVASAPAIFQRTMDTLLQGIPNVIWTS